VDPRARDLRGRHDGAGQVRGRLRVPDGVGE
jgi:hypothetical protein